MVDDALWLAELVVSSFFQCPSLELFLTAIDGPELELPLLHEAFCRLVTSRAEQ
jgi:hypothetical protein